MSDAVAQRRALAALFLGLYCYKLREVLDYSPYLRDLLDLYFPIPSKPSSLSEDLSGSHGYLFIKWCILDILFLTIVKFLRIPKLRLTKLGFVILLALSFLLNATLFTNNSWFTSKDKGVIPPSNRGSQHGIVNIPSYHYTGSEKKAVRDEQKLGGSVTVVVHPYSTAKMNPENSSFCLMPERIPNCNAEDVIRIPVLLKGSPPWTLEYSRRELNNPENILDSKKVVLGESKQAEIDNKAKTKQLFIEVHHPGYYTLDKLLDGQGTEGKVFGHGAYIVDCPVAFWGRDVKEVSKAWSYDPSLVKNEDACVTGEDYQLGLIAYGVPPLSVTYLRQRDSVEMVVSVDDIGKSDKGNVKEEKQGVVAEFILVPLSINMDTSGQNFLKVLEVTDGLNNTVLFEPRWRYTKETFIEASRSSTVECRGRGDRTLLQVHSHPNARFNIDPTHKSSIRLKDGKPTHSISAGIYLQGAAPWTLTYEFIPLEAIKNQSDSLTLTPYQQSVNITISPYNLQVNQPGKYKLLHVMDKYCAIQPENVKEVITWSGILEPSTFFVEETIPPTFKVVESPMEESCVGKIGLAFDITLTGQSPWTVEYKERFMPTKMETTHSIVINKPQDLLRVTPRNNGQYEFTFTKLFDANFPEGIPIVGHDENGFPKELKFTHVIHPQPNAFFKNNMKRREETHKSMKSKKCVGEHVEVAVVFEGTGPWNLKYEAIFEQKGLRSVMSESNIMPSKSSSITEYHFNTTDFDVPGTYVLNLLQVEDANGCRKVLENEILEVDVRSDRPRAVFATDNSMDIAKEVVMLEGKGVDLPLRLTGYAPWTLEYEYQSFEGGPALRYFADQIFDPNAVLSSLKPGRYELLNVRDAYCLGSIGSGEVGPMGSNYVIVKQAPKPFIVLSLDEQEQEFHQTQENGVSLIERRASCQGEEVVAHLSFNGKSPWYLRYISKKASKKEALGYLSTKYDIIKSNELRMGYPKAKILLNTQQPGRYAYEFRDISDDNYKEPFKPFIQLLGNGEPPSLSQFFHLVKPRPTAVFVPSKEYYQCISTKGPQEDPSTEKENDIVVSLTGVPPFAIEIEVKHETRPTVFHYAKDIDTFTFTLNSQKLFKYVGLYTLTITHVSDATMCSSDAASLSRSDGSEARTTTYKVYDRVSILPSKPQPWFTCIHKLVHFTLQGSSPWLVQYSVNGKMQPTVRQTESEMQLYVSEPGEVVLESVCHLIEEHGEAVGRCCEYPNLAYKVYDEPSATISHGQDAVENIREGDETEIVLDLKGIPPFRVTYIREPISTEGVPSSPESYVITDIQEHQYKFKTSLEGIFKLSKVSDKYCEFPRVDEDLSLK